MIEECYFQELVDLTRKYCKLLSDDLNRRKDQTMFADDNRPFMALMGVTVLMSEVYETSRKKGIDRFQSFENALTVAPEPKAPILPYWRMRIEPT